MNYMKVKLYYEGPFISWCNQQQDIRHVNCSFVNWSYIQLLSLIRMCCLCPNPKFSESTSS